MTTTDMSIATGAATPMPVLRLAREFKAPPMLVFRAFSEPAHLMQWFGPQGFTVTVCKTDCRIGGAWRIEMVSPLGNTYRVCGAYRAVEPGRRLAFSWAWEDEHGTLGHEMLVEVALQPRGDGTMLALTQTQFASEDACIEHEKGWSSALDCLVAYLQGGVGN